MTEAQPEQVAESPAAETLKKTFIALKRAQARIADLEARQSSPIAIIGMACRLPGGANSPSALWELLCRGADTSRPVPPERWPSEDYYDSAASTSGRTHAKRAHFLDVPVDEFDAPFFGISAKEATAMDPQQRLLLELSWEAFENAGIDPSGLRGSRTGVFIGISSDDYAQAHRHSGQLDLIDGYSLTGSCFAPCSGRISYTFGLEGPSLAIDTACSSSLVATHLACQSLREGESDLALAAGVNLILSPVFHIASSKLGTISPDGLCKTFDASADGYGRGEGCGVIVLKRLADAQRDGDQILALIRGSAVNQDGKSNGLTAPNGLAQERVIREALSRANLEPDDISYIEVHGTGTPLGDPIEVEAIGRVMAKRSPDLPVILGTVKTNIGHLEAAAGIAGLIKTVQCLRHGEIPAHLHLDNPSPHIAWGSYPFKVVQEQTAWASHQAPRRAGISSFGFSGTNAHLILEEAPAVQRLSSGDGRPMLLPLSSRTAAGLRDLAAEWRDWLTEPSTRADDACATAAVGRAHMSQRLALTGLTKSELIEGLSSFLAGNSKRNLATGVASEGTPKIAALFTGQGSQYPGMARALYDSEPVFRAMIDACHETLLSLGGCHLLDEIYGSGACDENLRQTAISQPAIFAIEIALFHLWQSWGIRPHAVCGHSVGEYAAAYAAGILSLADALAMVVARGRIMQSLPAGGAMAAVFAKEATVTKYMRPEDEISLAAVNTPNDVVISGAAEDVDGLLKRLSADGIAGQLLNVSHAFHSAYMRPAVEAFEPVAKRTYGQATLTFVSTVSGRKAAPGELATAKYWARQIEAPVRFAAAAMTLADEGCSIFLEMGPATILSGLARQCVQSGDRLFIASLTRGGDDRRQMIDSLAQLYVRGAPVDWKKITGPESRRIVAPNTPFQRKSYYLPPLPGSQSTARVALPVEGHPYLGQRVRSPLLPSGVTLFQAAFSTDYPSFLREHQIFDKMISPAAAHLSMAVAACGGQALEDVSFTAPLVIEPGAPRLVQLIVEAGTTPAYRLVSQAVAAANDEWTVHSSGRASVLGAAPSQIDIEAIRARCPEQMEPEAFYSLIEQLGYKTGPNFQCITVINKGKEESLCRMEPRQQIDPAAIHPGFIDSLLQCVLPACEDDASHMLDGESLLVPLHAGRLSVFGNLNQPIMCHTRTVISGEVITAQIYAYDERGVPVVMIEDFLLKRTNRATLYHELGGDDRGLVHRIEWQALEISQTPKSDDGWLVLVETDGWGAAIAAHLRQGGSSCLEIYRAELGENPDRLRDLIIHRTAEFGGKPFNLIFAWHGAGVEKTDPVADCRGVSAALLPLVQTLGNGANAVKPRLWILTRQAQSVVLEDRGVPSPSLDGAMLWGAGRAISREMPHIWGGLIDVESWPTQSGVSALVSLIESRSGEDQTAIRRGGIAFAARLSSGHVNKPCPSLLSLNNRYILNKGARQTLDDLRFDQLPRIAPGAGEIEIEILGAGLNFRDVLNALGHYPGDAGMLGFEAVGIVVALGEGVAGLEVGDCVIGLAVPGALGSHATLPRLRVLRKPAALTAAQAVSLPTTFLTAYYALHHLGQLKRGERVLIHAAAGGVGLAAVQLALSVGAEIFATAGSPEKQAYLKAMGVQHVMNSRTLDFAAEIRAVTGGQGVDVVLNSLSGDFISASFSVLAPRGRFLEMGKIGIWDTERVHSLDPSWFYCAFDLGTVALDDPEMIATMFQHVLNEVEAGRLAPLPVTLFPMEEAEEAFRFMAQARHIGKIVLSREDERRQLTFASQGVTRPDASYLVTGGLGALGLRVALWLADAGARHIVLAGRQSPKSEAREIIAQLTLRGVTVVTVAADVATEQGVAAMIAAAPTPLAGVIHAAGILEDGMIADLDPERLGRIMAPKVKGAWLLHEAVRNLDLDFFILFSSVAAIIGNLGQGGYAMANAFMDGLAAYRRAQGLAASSINWGPWAEAGMAARLENDRFSVQGIHALDPAEALLALDRVLNEGQAQAVVADADWRLFGQVQGSDGKTGLFANLSRPSGAQKQVVASLASPRDIMADLRAALPVQREDMLRLYLQDLARQTLGYADDDLVSTNQPLADQGFDSLMSVDMRNRLNRAFDRVFPASLLFDFPTLDRIAKHVLETVIGEDDAAVPSSRDMTAEELLDEIEDLIGR